MHNDRHLEVIERATMDNFNNESELIYEFEDGKTFDNGTVERIGIKKLVKEFGIIKTVKKRGSI